MNQHESCEVCSAYKNYKILQRKGINDEDAFHEAVAYAMGEVIEDLLEIGFEEAFGDGYVSALRSISRQTDEIANQIELESKSEYEYDEEDTEEVYVVDMECGVNCPCNSIEDCIDEEYTNTITTENFSDEDFIRWLKKRW